MTFTPGMIVLKPGQGRRVDVRGNVHFNKAISTDTSGAWALVEQHVTGATPPLHLHEREDEAWYVLQGHVRIWIGDSEIDANTGSFVLAPRGVPHTFARQPGPELKLLVFLVPGGLERMFDEMTLLSKSDRQNPSVLAEVASRYGIQLLGPPRQ